MLLRPVAALALICVHCLGTAAPDPVPTTSQLGPTTHRVPVTLGQWTGFTVDLGAIQGVSVVGDALYIYGDAETGVIAEYDLQAARRGELVPTGRRLKLTIGGEDVAPHPTGLTSLDGRVAILGDTVARVGKIHFIDWELAWARGTLDGAILHSVQDDAAINGTRPHAVRFDGHWLIATSDYGDSQNAVRLYDPELLRLAEKTSEPGVLRHSFRCGPYVQNVHWLDELGVLMLIQNREPGLLYRLGLASLVDLQHGADLRDVPNIDLDAPTDELEGFATLGGGMCIMVSAMPVDNVWIGPMRIGSPTGGSTQR